MWAPLMSSGSPFLMGATTLAVKGYIAPLFKITNDHSLLFISRITTFIIGLISLLLGFFVKEILREVTWIAVFLSAIVYIVFIEWMGLKVKSIYAFISLIGTIVIILFFFIFGIYKIIHPIWPVTCFIGIIMVIACFDRKHPS
jgi:Na+/proline symporter